MRRTTPPALEPSPTLTNNISSILSDLPCSVILNFPRNAADTQVTFPLLFRAEYNIVPGELGVNRWHRRDALSSTATISMTEAVPNKPLPPCSLNQALGRGSQHSRNCLIGENKLSVRMQVFPFRAMAPRIPWWRRCVAQGRCYQTCGLVRGPNMANGCSGRCCYFVGMRCG